MFASAIRNPFNVLVLEKARGDATAIELFMEYINADRIDLLHFLRSL